MPCASESGRQEGIHGWGPSAGPPGCKFLVYLRHTSPLAVKLLSLVYQQSRDIRFWIDFGGTNVPAMPFKFYFSESDHALADVDFDGLGRDREILLALVPRSIRRQVRVSLYVVGERGTVPYNIEFGSFQYNDQGVFI